MSSTPSQSLNLHPDRATLTIPHPDTPPTLDELRARFAAGIDWPERPTCHDGDWQSQRFGETSWRAPHGRYQYAGRDGYPDDCPPGASDENFRTCSYCGSIHPEDLARVLLAAPADYPPLPPEPLDAMHAYEVEHPNATREEALRVYDDAMRERYQAKAARVSLGGADWKYGWPHTFYVEGIPNPAAGLPACSGGASDSTYVNGERVYRVKPHISPAPATMGAKWYNDHLLDLTPEAFAFMAALIERFARVAFVVRDGKLGYGAPYYNYQQG